MTATQKTGMLVLSVLLIVAGFLYWFFVGGVGTCAAKMSENAVLEYINSGQLNDLPACFSRPEGKRKAEKGFDIITTKNGCGEAWAYEPPPGVVFLEGRDISSKFCRVHRLPKDATLTLKCPSSQKCFFRGMTSKGPFTFPVKSRGLPFD